MAFSLPLSLLSTAQLAALVDGMTIEAPTGRWTLMVDDDPAWGAPSLMLLEPSSLRVVNQDLRNEAWIHLLAGLLAIATPQLDAQRADGGEVPGESRGGEGG